LPLKGDGKMNNDAEMEKQKKRFTEAINANALPDEPGLQTFMRLMNPKEPVAKLQCGDGLKSLGENLEKLYWEARQEGKMLALDDKRDKAEEAFKIQDKIMEALDIYEKAF
jgi:hypothetical protein